MKFVLKVCLVGYAPIFAEEQAEMAKSMIGFTMPVRLNIQIKCVF
jgi:hypothetical protein